MRPSTLLVASAFFPLACQSSSAPTAALTEAPAAGPAHAPQQSGREKLTLDKVFELSTKLKLPSGSHAGWLDDGDHYLAVDAPKEGEKKQLFVVDAETGTRKPFLDPANLEKAFASLPGITAETAKKWSERTSFDFSKDRSAILLNESDDLFFHRLGSAQAVRLTSDPAEEVGETISPDGKWVAFVRDFNLYVVSTDGGAARALTTGGDENHLFGRLDWVYQEEVYGRGNFQAYWWSPDSKRVAMLALDETDVPTYTIADTRERHPKIEKWRYPKAGDPNPKARLAVIDVIADELGGQPRYFDLSAYPEDLLIVRVGWSPDGAEVVFQVQDRVQTWLELVSGDPESGHVRRILRDNTPAWIEPSDGPHWIEGGREFLWPSEHDGFKHLYVYKRDGTFVRRVTQGQWEVDEFHLYDPATKSVWFSGDREDVKGTQLYRVGIDGANLTQVTKGAGVHGIALSPNARWYVDTFSSAAVPTHSDLFRADGKPVRALAKVDPLLLAPYGLRPPEFHQPKTRDGFVMEAFLIKPVDFDPSKKYPVMCHTYGGPHAPQVRDSFANFNTLFHQMLANEGYLVWVCDSRSASGKGLASAMTCWRNFGEGEVRDLEDGLDYLVNLGFVDSSRIGIWGWSFGGYMASYALTHSKRFKMGIAGAPVTDWSLYDSIYTERFMGLPKDNPEGYKKSSARDAAHNLSGRLLVICGEIDENVHAQNSLQLAQKLQQADKLFELMVYPGNRHGIVDPKQKRHLYSMIADYVRTHL